MAARAVDASPTPVTLRLPFAATSVAVARRILQQWFTDVDQPCTVIDDARVVLSELVGNSIRHARPLPDGTLTVSWRLVDRGLEVSVTDGGASTRPRKVDAGRSALAGRGMVIIERLAASWWTEQTPSRSTVHALLSLR